jgi:hypothetical protein
MLLGWLHPEIVRTGVVSLSNQEIIFPDLFVCELSSDVVSGCC